MARILVIGSMNMDIVTGVSRHPVPGETIHGKHTAFYSGGKGANQAVAAARSGAEVTMAGALGDDFFGREIRRLLAEDGIETGLVRSKRETTGVAIITVDERGENNIVLSGGANSALTPADLADVDWAAFDAVLLQNEIPWTVNEYVLERCRPLPVRLFFNPAPAMKLDRRTLPLIDVLLLNEVEAKEISGLAVAGPDEAGAAALRFVEDGVGCVVVTLGEQGAAYADRDGRRFHTPAYPVKAVDTTAAGDTFIGAFAARLLSGAPVGDSLRYASAAAALTVTGEGAQTSIPAHPQISRFIRERDDSA